MGGRVRVGGVGVFGSRKVRKTGSPGGEFGFQSSRESGEKIQVQVRKSESRKVRKKIQIQVGKDGSREVREE